MLNYKKHLDIILIFFYLSPISCQSLKEESVLSIGKKELTMATIGGSVCMLANSCREYWAEQLNLSITDYSKSGFGFGKEGFLIPDIVNQLCSDKSPKYDIYLFWCSTNDYGAKVTIGNYDSYTENDGYDNEALKTQCGGINYCLQKILKKNPSATILLFTSLPSFNGNGYQLSSTNNDDVYLYKYVDAQIELCRYWGIPYFEQFYSSPFNQYNYSEYYREDNLHLNSKGYNKIKKAQTYFIANAYLSK